MSNATVPRVQVLLAALCFGTTGTAQALGPNGASPLTWVPYESRLVRLSSFARCASPIAGRRQFAYRPGRSQSAASA